MAVQLEPKLNLREIICNWRTEEANLQKKLGKQEMSSLRELMERLEREYLLEAGEGRVVFNQCVSARFFAALVRQLGFGALFLPEPQNVYCLKTLHWIKSG